MNLYVTDTHALFWYLTASPKLSPNAKACFDEGQNGQALIYISPIVLAELFYLNEKFGEPIDFAAEYDRFTQAAQYVLPPLTSAEILDLKIDQAVSEMHDRLIAGLARRLGAVLISRDNRTGASTSMSPKCKHLHVSTIGINSYRGAVK
jgi:PIN domain nuclease of toxin-antitoxin system